MIYKEKGLDKVRSERKVFFYPGCAIEYFYPEMGLKMVEFLNKAGYQVDIPEVSVCCGLPAIHAGDGKSAKETILKNIGHMGHHLEYEAFLVLCPSCGMAMKEEFKAFIFDHIPEYKKINDIGEKVISFAQFIKEKELKLQVDNRKIYTYHTPCHLGRGLRFDTGGFLKGILGDHFVNLKDSNVCCGFGGSFSFDFPEVSGGILAKKIENILATKADCVLTDCPGCIMQIDGGLKARGLNIEVKHISEIF
jgi:Fe-S oxidoreductase